ncbi:MAG: hypothetical protein J7499_01920 [Sphingopyxis sp.]|nr:hypothetical protein [Sphingopyxis sp.]
MAQDECAWEKRAALPAPVQRYLSYIFQNPDDRYRPYRSPVGQYLKLSPGYVSRRVELFTDIDKSRPYSLYQSNSSFPPSFLQMEAGSYSLFSGYRRANHAISNYRLVKYDGADFSGLGPVSFVGFNSLHYSSRDAQAAAIIKQNPRLFRAGEYKFERAGDACLIVTQTDGDRLTALLTIYDGSETSDKNRRQKDFLQCRDRHDARYLGLRYWPSVSAYSSSVDMIPAPDYGFGGSVAVPHIPASKPTAPGDSRAPLSSGVRGGRLDENSPMLPAFLAWEVQKSEDAMKIIALDGASDFEGVCGVTMNIYRKRWPNGVEQWANEGRMK